MVMNAVRAGVPVLGGNLPRTQMKQAMGEARYDSHLPAAGWQLQLDAIKDGHCGLLPESQFAPMARIQLARDEAIVRNRLVAFEADTERYRFLVRNEALSPDRIIGVVEWRDGTVIDVVRQLG